MNFDILYIIYMLGKRGDTIDIRAGRSVRLSSWVVCVVWRLNTVVVFSYYCSSWSVHFRGRKYSKWGRVV